MKLSNLKTGSKAKIEKILEKKEVKVKLTSLGLSVDSEILMIKNDKKGSLILAVDQNRIIIGRDLAEKIEIKML